MEPLRRIHMALGGRWLFVLGFALCCALYEYGRVMNLRPLPMHLWRQADCLSLTWNYYAGHASFLHPEIHARIADGGESGKSAGEFPLLYWTMAQVWKVTGQSEFVYRLSGLLLHFLASFTLFLSLRRLLKSDFWSLGIALLLFTSPVLVYYGISFLTDVPAFDLAIIGWYFVVRHAQEKRRRWWVLAMAAFALATLLKVTAGMSLVALLALYFMATVRPSWAGTFRLAFPSPGFGWAAVAAALTAILAWYMHAEAYNELHRGRYTFNSLWPIWEMDAEGIDRAIRWAKDILIFQVFDTSVWLFIGMALLVIILHTRHVPRLVLLLNLFLFIGLVLYTVFWFNAVDGHDYYFINPLITLVVPMVTFLWWLRERRPDLFHASWFRWAFLLLLGYNVAYAANNLTMRSNPESHYDRADLLPLYHCQEPAFWNAIAFGSQRDYHDLSPYLRSLGVEREDLVISLDDPTINASLYFMGQQGFTQYGWNYEEPGTIERCIERGAKYLVFVDERWERMDHLAPHLTRPLGRQGRVRVFDLRNIEYGSRSRLIFDQEVDALIPLPHRTSAAPCEHERGWCFAGNEWPLELEALPLAMTGPGYAELRVRGVLGWGSGHAGGNTMVLATDADTGPLGQQAQELGEGEFDLIYRVPQYATEVRHKLYLWNRTGTPFRMEGLKIEVVRRQPIE